MDARRFIDFIAPNYSVIMLNEAYNKPLHRAFAYSLLDDLYKRGFRYPGNGNVKSNADQELTKLTYKTGHFAAEPVAGELIRLAQELGYKLIAYEDPLGNQTYTYREGFNPGIEYCGYIEAGSSG